MQASTMTFRVACNNPTRASTSRAIALQQSAAPVVMRRTGLTRDAPRQAVGATSSRRVAAWTSRGVQRRQLGRQLVATEDNPAVSKSGADAAPSWTIKYLYDGDCSMCRGMKSMLERQDAGRGLVQFVNIATDSYDPSANEGIEYEDAMDTIHAIRANGEILTGTSALLELYDTVGLGWQAKLGTLPVFAQLLEMLYQVLSKLRLPIGGAMDNIMAARRLKMSQEGVEHCVDDEEECAAPEW